MQKRPWEISDLLALADGQPHTAGIPGDDPAVAAELDRLRQVRSELRSLPDVPLDDEVWQQLLPPARRPSPWLRFPLATAASVFFASVIGMYLLFGNTAPGSNGFDQTGEYAAVSADSNGLQLASLMRQSRDLEQRLHGANPLSPASDLSGARQTAPAAPSAAEQMLLFRLADVDSQIARLYEAEQMDTARREALWTQRVDLLQSLVAVRGGSDPRMFEDMRSM